VIDISEEGDATSNLCGWKREGHRENNIDKIKGLGKEFGYEGAPIKLGKRLRIRLFVKKEVEERPTEYNASGHPCNYSGCTKKGKDGQKTGYSTHRIRLIWERQGGRRELTGGKDTH